MQDRSSRTAELMALQRAFESHRPSRSRLFEDPFARSFLHGWRRIAGVLARVPMLRSGVTRLYDAVGGPGPRPSAIARTRAIHDIVDGAAQTMRQLVILGAGFDARAHRLPSLHSVRVFEVDHPATQATKRAAIRRLGSAATNVAYVPVDFERDALDAALLASGFDPSLETLVLWEGVTNYLTEPAVDATLRTVRDLTTAGGTLVLTYVDARALDGSGEFPEAARWIRGVERSGEPWTFGLLPEQAAGFLAARGFTLVSDASTAELGDPRFRALGRRDRGSRLYRVAVARVGDVAERGA